MNRLTLTDIASLSPLLILLGGALLILLMESFLKEIAKKLNLFLTLATIFAALYACIAAPSSQNPLLTPWVRFDAFSQMSTIFFLCVGAASALLAASFFKTFDTAPSEYSFLLLSCLFGLILIGTSADLLTLFLGMETLSISLYILCGYMKKWEISHESSVKYFLIGSLAAAFLLYGIALVYGAVGTTRLDLLLSSFQQITAEQQKTLFLSGIALITLGLAFKAAIVPFHFWAPDVYAGSPTPVTAFMSVGTKAGAFAAFARIFLDALPQFHPLWGKGIALLAIPTLIYANFVAVRQNQLRRFFAYSGISHAGFLLIALAAGTPDAFSAMNFYIVVYAFATLGAFAVLAYMDNSIEGATMQDLKGLFHRSPLLAATLSLCLLTLAGIPPTAGFFAKFYLFKVAFEAGYTVLVIIALATTVLSAYYYLRMISYMFYDTAETPISKNSWPAAVVGTVSLIAIVAVSFFPAPLLERIQKQPAVQQEKPLP